MRNEYTWWIKILWILFDSELVTHPRRKWTSLPSWIYLFTENIIKENPSLGPAWFCLFALLRINKSEQWAYYPVSLKSNSFKLIVRYIVVTVTCPCRGLALNPDELLSGREGDVASFGGGWVDQSISEWSAAPCAAWPIKGFQTFSTAGQLRIQVTPLENHGTSGPLRSFLT